MSEDITAAPERVWLVDTDESGWAYDYRDGKTLAYLEPPANDDWKGVEYHRAELCAGVDAEGAAKAVVSYLFDDYPDEETKRGGAEVRVADIIRKYCRDSAEVARLKGEYDAVRKHSDHVIGEYAKDIERLQGDVGRLMAEKAAANKLAEHAMGRLAAARAEAIRECVERVKAFKSQWLDDYDCMVQQSPSARYISAKLDAANEIIAALEGAPVEEPAEPENAPTTVDPKAAAALISFLTRPIPEENVLRAEDDEEEAAPPEVLVSREEAAKAVCWYCNNPSDYTPAELVGDRLWHRPAYGSRRGIPCKAAAIRAMPPYGEKEKK